MSDHQDLHADLLAMASHWRQLADNLVSSDWHESYGDMPVTRQRQYGMAVINACAADEIASLLGIDPRSLWPEFRLPEPLPENERSRFVWTDGVER